jgi:DNA replication ATP-dependent helicase Dna2
VVVLTTVLRELVALPVAVAFHLADVLDALPNPRYAFAYERSGLFDFQLSNALKSDAIFQAWNDGRAEAAEWVRTRLTARLRAAGNVVDGLRAVIAERLFAWPPKFRFPERFDFAHVELSRIAFVTRYESLSNALECRTSRTRPAAERERDGTRIPLEHLGVDRWRVGSALDDSHLDLDDFWNRLLATDDEAGEQAQMAFDDYRTRAWFPTPTALLGLAKVIDKVVDPTTGLVTELVVERHAPRGRRAAPAGGREARAAPARVGLHLRPHLQAPALHRRRRRERLPRAGARPRGLRRARGGATFLPRGRREGDGARRSHA